MEDNRWDDHLRDLLGEYKPGDAPSSPVHKPQASAPTAESDLQDKSWKRIEASLDAADHAFDESMRRKIGHYHPPYDQSSWPIFLQRFADHQFLRARLVMLKMIEVSALVLLLITAVKLGFVTNLHQSDTPGNPAMPSGSFTDAIDRNANTTNASNDHHPLAESAGKNVETVSSGTSKVNTDDHRANVPSKNKSTQNASGKNKKSFASNRAYANSKQFGSIADNSSHRGMESNSANSKATDYTSSSIGETTSVKNSAQHDDNSNAFDTRSTSTLPAIDIAGLESTDATNAIGDITPSYNAFVTDPISALDSEIEFEKAITVPGAKYSKPKERKYTEFAVLAQSDYNGLRMPEDRLFTYGQQIIFPQQGIMSQGFGGGFTIAIGHPRWAVETGVIYSAKDFQPGRQLIVGGVFDNGSIEFQAMRLQLVSVPVQYRYRFDHKGRMKFYGIAGGGFNMIVQSDIDVQVKYNFPSLSFGANPNADPNLAETIRETRRISEHIRDGAPFSTKNFVSVNAGVGGEYQLTEYKTLFMQGMVLYQIPDLAFSNNNGKHLRSVSLQVGVRTPLGK